MVKQKIKALLIIGVMCLKLLPVSAELIDVSYLNLQNITQESAFAITKDIDFTKVNSLADESGNIITWQSSDASIEINGEKGIVKRGAEDKNVMLTATVNTTPETVKEFNLTVIISAMFPKTKQEKTYRRRAAVHFGKEQEAKARMKLRFHLTRKRCYVLIRRLRRRVLQE